MFSTGGDAATTREIWQYLRTFLIVATGGERYWQKLLTIPQCTGQMTQPQIIWSKTSTEPRSRNCGSMGSASSDIQIFQGKGVNKRQESLRPDSPSVTSTAASCKLRASKSSSINQGL